MKNKIKNEFGHFKGKETSFCSLLLSTGKYKELYNIKTIEVITAIIGSILFTGVIIYVSKVNIDGFNEGMKNICLYLGSSLIGLLGFVIAGLSILTGTLGFDIAKKINDEKKADKIIGIFFSFYFIGMVIGVEIVLFFFSYFLLFIKTKEIIFLPLVLMSVLLSYLFVFAIFYSIGLLGTCLRMFLINYNYKNNLPPSDNV